jgi:hypothetical protein
VNALKIMDLNMKKTNIIRASKKPASIAAKVLSHKKATPQTKSLAGSVLVNRKKRT